MDKLEIEINEAQTSLALTKLVNDLTQSYQLGRVESNTLWDLIEQLDSVTFMSLHKNVYFADFLRQIYIKTSCVQFAVKANEGTDQLDIPEQEAQTIVEPEILQRKVLLPEHAKFLQKEDSFQQDMSEENSGGTKTYKPSQEHINIPNLETPLDNVTLPERFLKLIKRLRNASFNNSHFSLGNTLQDLVNLPVAEVASLIGVGISYVETLKELKALVTAQNGYFPDIEKTFDFSQLDTSNFLISMSGVEQRFTKPLAKYARHFELPNLTRNIDLILTFEKDSLLKLPSFGRNVVDNLMEFKAIIQNEIQAIAQGEINYLALQSSIIVPLVFDEMALRDTEQILLEDIDNFLDKLSEEEVEIAQSRWGFIEEKKTLEEMGALFSLTRERIRQKEANINNQLILNLRINPAALWQLLEPQMQSTLSTMMQDLFSCFSSEKAFYEFLEIVCQQEGLFEYVYPEIDKTILNAYFAENGAPIHIQDAIDVIEGENLVNIRNTRNAILNLKNQGVLVVEDEYIWPKLLGKSEASACVLVNHSKGLPWSDIAKLVNANGYSRTEIYEDRVDTEAFKHKDYIYLAGKGVYKHTRFINTDVINLEQVFAELDAYIVATSRDVFHLNEGYQASGYLKRFNYYEIRHFVKHFGEDYGYYFEGRSQTDSVGREKGFKNITQKNVILEAMNARDKPLTKPEIAGLLKSKSLAHAAFYLDGLIHEARVVQVDHQMYTTPEQAYKNIELSIYLDAMQRILEKCGKPVDASIFQQTLNPLLSVSYSKYFYMGIARCFSTGKGWYRAHGLYSATPIPFNNLADALNTYCNKDEPVKNCIEKLQQHVAITTDNASRIIHNWRNLSVP